jgi:GNAT superfamily N-acetyltransferase
MTEFISTIINDEELWLKFYNLSREISHRHYPGSYKPDDTVEKFIKRRQDSAAIDATYEQFVLLDNGTALGWLDTSVWNDQLFFGFNLLNDEQLPEFMRHILSKADKIMDSNGYREAFYHTYHMAIESWLKKENARVYEEFIISRLERVNMDVAFYNNIVKDNPLNKWRLEYYDCIPDNIVEQFTIRINEYFDDFVSRNPYKIKIPPLTVNSYRKNTELLKSGGTTPGVYILFDNEIIAGLCWICFDSHNPETLRHLGGMTGVTKEYRGKGIARYLKTKMYLKLLEENNDFRYITTDTMPWNKYMYNINNEFGFKLYLKGCAFKITKEFLENYLISR